VAAEDPDPSIYGGDFYFLWLNWVPILRIWIPCGHYLTAGWSQPSDLFYIFYLFFELLIVTVRSQSNGSDLIDCSAVISLRLHWIQVPILHITNL
jgi:hypothetical protein